MIKIMIADDNIELSDIMKTLLSQNSDFQVVKQTYTGIETINHYLTLKPDILILDMEIPSLNGTDVINYLCNHSIEEQHKCNILIVSGKIKKYPLNCAEKVFRIIQKPYDWDFLYKSINDCYKFQLSTKKNTFEKENIKNILERLKFDFSHTGSKFLLEAILLVKESSSPVFTIDNLYIELAQKHSTSPRRVKWNIENSINSSYKHSSISSYKTTFPNYDERKPTPKYLISLFCNLTNL